MEHPPDPWFFYTLCIVFVGALIWVIVRYTNKIDTILVKVQETLQEVKITNSLHGQKLEFHGQKLELHEKEIAILKDKAFTVKYQK